MPTAVTDLEDEIDHVAGTGRWVRGASGLVDWLSATHFDFRSHRAAMIAAYAVKKADESTVIGLIDRGAPLELNLNPPDEKPLLLGDSIISQAIYFGRTNLFLRMVQLGWLDRITRKTAAEMFASHGANCNPAFVIALSRAGVPIDVPEDVPPTSEQETGVTYGETALSKAASDYDCRDEDSRVETVSRLLSLGADPNRRNSKGETAIFGVENVTVLNMLLRAGADATVKDGEGNSAVFGSWTDDIVVRLLEAGASPNGQYYDGLTLRQQALARRMPKAMAWLNANAKNR